MPRDKIIWKKEITNTLRKFITLRNYCQAYLSRHKYLNSYFLFEKVNLLGERTYLRKSNLTFIFYEIKRKKKRPKRSVCIYFKVCKRKARAHNDVRRSFCGKAYIRQPIRRDCLLAALPPSPVHTQSGSLHSRPSGSLLFS